MPRQRRAYLHVGLDDGSGDVVDVALGVHAHALLDLGVRRAAATAQDSVRAALDVLGRHDELGYRRDEVAGAWEHQARRARAGRDTIVVSAPLLAAADRSVAAAAVDSFDDFEVHVVVTVRPPGARTPPEDLLAVLAAWSSVVRPDRLHVVMADGPTATWRAVGRVCGFGTASLAAPLEALSTTRRARSLVG